uniref:Uncharacterized protein n=1 Tax=Candidatus Kentrum sp. SD TaxID=2126332 RepID=A0A451BJ22_9GAMM|nr:MAG: hypothetical protein BECKSD772D_GA0070982_101014 [Candidatus Kentron sp. SD]
MRENQDSEFSIRGHPSDRIIARQTDSEGISYGYFAALQGSREDSDCSAGKKGMRLLRTLRENADERKGRVADMARFDANSFPNTDLQFLSVIGDIPL